MHQENHPIPGHNKRALNAPKPNPVSKGTIMHKPYIWEAAKISECCWYESFPQPQEQGGAVQYGYRYTE